MEDVERLMAGSGPAVKKLMQGVYDAFVTSAGCTAYVKTIYVGFELDEMMVAAAYPHVGSVEVALALQDGVDGPGLIDATHLTWRTMPVAVEMRTQADLRVAQAHFATAIARARTGVHDVELPDERFRGRERRIANPKIIGQAR